LSLECPDEELLLAFTDGGLDFDEAARVSAHVAGCSECREVLAGVARNTTLPTLPTTATEAPAPLRRGVLLGRYVVLDCIGTGGMGAVYSAYDPELDRRVALKVLRSEGLDQQHLLAEARALAKLSHPNVVAVHDVGALDGRVFIAMELLGGKSLRAWMAGGRELPELLDVFIGCARGLHAAHAAGLVHRDFKPENVRVADDRRARVIDFGLVSIPQEALAGTPAYMAPEQRLGAADARSDQYAFFLSLHEALYGALPGSPPKRNPKVPRALARVLQRGLSAEPFARFDGMEAVVHALERVRSAGVRASAVAAMVVLAGIAIAGGVAVGRSQREACTGAEKALAPAWNPERAAKLKAAFGTAAARADRAVEALDAWAAAWTAGHREACEATRVRGEQTEELMVRRMRCLEVQRHRLDAVVSLFEQGGKATVERAGEAVAGLPRVAECADTRVLLERVAPPQDAALRQRIEAASRKLDEAVARRQLYRFGEGLELAKAAAVEAEAIGWPPLTAEALLHQGAIATRAGDHAAGVEALWRALHQAKLGHDARLEAVAWMELAYTVGNRLRHRTEAERLFELAEAQIAALREPGDLEHLLPLYEGVFWRDIGEIDRGIELLRRSLAMCEAAKPVNRHALMQTLVKLGDALVAARRFAEAEAVLRRVLKMGEEDETVAGKLDSTLTMLADALSQQGRHAEARAASERAVEIAQDTGEGPLRQAYSLQMLATVQRRAGDLEAAANTYTATAALLTALPEPNPWPGESLGQLGDMYAENKQWDRAEPYLKKTLEIFGRTLEPDDPAGIAYVAALVRTLAAKGDKEGAARVLEDGLAIVQRNKGTPESLAEPRFLLAKAQWELDRAKALALAKVAAEGAQGPLASDIAAWLKQHE